MNTQFRSPNAEMQKNKEKVKQLEAHVRRTESFLKILNIKCQEVTMWQEFGCF